jgi:WD40-like Beta Propeller Repeat
MRHRLVARACHGLLAGLIGAACLAGIFTSCGSVARRGDGTGGSAGGLGGAGGADDGGGLSDADDAPVATDDGGVVCAPSKAFAAPLIVPGLNLLGTNSNARFMPDELTAYFANLRAADGGGTGNYEIFTAARPQRSAAFGAARALAGINSATASDYDPVLTGDGQTLYFGSTRTQAADRIFVSIFNPITSNFSPPVVIDSLSQAADAGANAPATLDALQPYVLPDNNVLYFGSARAGTRDIYRATRTTAGFSRATAVAEVNTTSLEQFPTVSPDELVIYWASNRTDAGARGGFDVWMATRASTSVPFGSVRNVTEVNSTTDDFPSWISPDGCRLYLTTRAGLSIAERTP